MIMNEQVNQIADELDKGRRDRPGPTADNKYVGDIFYDDINRRCESAFGKKTPKQKANNHAAFRAVCDILRKRGFYVHS